MCQYSVFYCNEYIYPISKVSREKKEMLCFFLMFNSPEHLIMLFSESFQETFLTYLSYFHHISSNSPNLSLRIEGVCDICNCMLNLPYICFPAIRNPRRCCFYYFRRHPIWTSNNCVEVRHYAASLTRKIYSNLSGSIFRRLRCCKNETTQDLRFFQIMWKFNLAIKVLLRGIFFFGGGALFLDLTEYIFANVEYGESSQEFISKAMPVMNL